MWRANNKAQCKRRISFARNSSISHIVPSMRVCCVFEDDQFYNNEGWTPNCLDFMQHLSNRYFNRALFLLLVKDDHEKPDEIEKLGMRDLEISRDMDYEIVEYGEDVGFNRASRAHKLWQVYLVRAKGHNMLLEMGYADSLTGSKNYPDEFELSERLDDYFRMLQNEMKREDSELFHDITTLGRLQEIETELMKYKMLTGDVNTAAKIAIRLLKEDSWVFAETAAVAVEVLLVYTNGMKVDHKTRNKIALHLMEHAKQMDKDMDDEQMSRAGSTIASSVDELSVRMPPGMLKETSAPSFRRASSASNWMKKRSSGCVTMEDF